ncbi:hypothetical protein Nans01_15250 [Nocardiopsis ansamitocini]|uniref:XRE family transcriptional regulator n=2 Tax=Nocardiopsis ansamitocini TaxID=1670832 RepID=A0A9W6P4H1_9ACTN|nr:hypothetical protein Nans01_15250 [Nocardiopsis ansamitocini]
MTREVLAGLVGKSPSWVKAVESGRLGTPKLSILLCLAENLRMRDLSELTGQESVPTRLFTGPGHELLPTVRRAVDSVVIPTERPAPSVRHLRARLDSAWVARHCAPNHRRVLGGLLPDLIADAQLAARQAESGRVRRAAQAVLAEVYALSQFFIAYQPPADLLWRVAERGLVAAQDSGDLHVIGISAWLMAQAHRDAGDWDAADLVTEQTVHALSPCLADGTDAERAVNGALLFEAGYTAARRGESGTAWGYWDAANAVAQRLPSAYYHPVTSFSRAIMGAHAVTIAVELRAAGESVRQAHAATAYIPSRPRRARHQIETARAHHLAGDTVSALATLENAHFAAPETIRYNGYARSILLEEMEAHRGELRQRAADLAVKVGAIST